MKMSNKELPLVPRLLKLAQKFNCFYLDGLDKGECRPFIVCGEQVGLVRSEVVNVLKEFPSVFSILPNGSVALNPSLLDYGSRSSAIEAVLTECRNKDVFLALRGWRDECFEIRTIFSGEPLMKMDRSATCLFGIHSYCVYITGYVRHPDRGLCIWLQRRSPTKQTWPGKWDNMVGGGLSVGFGVLETAYKEAEEEASIPAHLLKNLRPAGCVSFYFESERGLFPNTEFVYDLELPLDFVPKNNDGEVDIFELLPTNEALERVLSPDFKTTSCAVVVDFLIRHGVISPDGEPVFPQLVELLHVPLQSIYRRWQPSEHNGRVT